MASIARKWRARLPVIRETFIRGGLKKGVARRATIAGHSTVEAEEAEEFLHFQQRVRSQAESVGAQHIIYGGLPANPDDWEVPPGQDEALARTGWTDELDLDE